MSLDGEQSHQTDAMWETLLRDTLESAVAHLPADGEPHWHMVFAYRVPEMAEPLAATGLSAPYGDEEVAKDDLRKLRQLVFARGYDIGVLPCQRRCPRSSIGNYGWPPGVKLTTAPLRAHREGGQVEAQLTRAGEASASVTLGHGVKPSPGAHRSPRTPGNGGRDPGHLGRFRAGAPCAASAAWSQVGR